MAQMYMFMCMEPGNSQMCVWSFLLCSMTLLMLCVASRATIINAVVLASLLLIAQWIIAFLSVGWTLFDPAAVLLTFRWEATLNHIEHSGLMTNIELSWKGHVWPFGIGADTQFVKREQALVFKETALVSISRRLYACSMWNVPNKSATEPNAKKYTN